MQCVQKVRKPVQNSEEKVILDFGQLWKIIVPILPKGSLLSDWVSEAQFHIEESFPGAVAIVTIGFGADQNSNPSMNLENPEMDLENAKKT